MEEVQGLTVGAIDWIIGKIEKSRGLIRGDLWNKRLCLGCVIGTLGWGTRGSEYMGIAFDKDHPWKSKWLEFGLGVINNYGTLDRTHITITLERVSEGWYEYFSDEVRNGTPEERRDYVIAWLQAQRDLKCCDWTPAPIEVVPTRKRKAVLA